METFHTSTNNKVLGNGCRLSVTSVACDFLTFHTTSTRTKTNVPRFSWRVKGRDCAIQYITGTVLIHWMLSSMLPVVFPYTPCAQSHSWLHKGYFLPHFVPISRQFSSRFIINYGYRLKHTCNNTDGFTEPDKEDFERKAIQQDN